MATPILSGFRQVRVCIKVVEVKNKKDLNKLFFTKRKVEDLPKSCVIYKRDLWIHWSIALLFAFLLFLVGNVTAVKAESYSYTTICENQILNVTNTTNTSVTTCFIKYTLLCEANTTCSYNLTVPQPAYDGVIENITKNITTEFKNNIRKCIPDVSNRELVDCQTNLNSIAKDYSILSSSKDMLNASLFDCRKKEIFETMYYNLTVNCEKSRNDAQNSYGFLGLIVGFAVYHFYTKRKAEAPPAGMQESMGLGV